MRPAPGGSIREDFSEEWPLSWILKAEGRAIQEKGGAGTEAWSWVSGLLPRSLKSHTSAKDKVLGHTQQQGMGFGRGKSLLLERGGKAHL